MKIVSKNSNKRRKGFTLLEMVLVLAIMVIMSVYLVSTFKIVNFSHLKVSKVNDMHDYASLSLQAISNKLCNATSISSGSKLKSDGTYIVDSAGNKLLSGFDMLYNYATTIKFKTDPGSKTVTVTIVIKDKNSDVSYQDQTVVYCPACTTMDVVDNAGGINYSYEQPK